MRDDSRTKMKLNGKKVDNKTLLLASLIDNTSLLVWMNTKDARNGTNKPKSVLKAMLSDERNENVSFASGDDFLEAFNKIAKG